MLAGPLRLEHNFPDPVCMTDFDSSRPFAASTSRVEDTALIDPNYPSINMFLDDVMSLRRSERNLFRFEAKRFL